MELAKRLPKFSWPFYGLLRQLGSCNYMGCLFKLCYHRKETSVSHYVNCIQICNPSKWFVFTFELSSLISVFTSLCFDLFFHVDYIYIDLNSDLLQFIFLCFLFFFFPRDLDEVYSIGHLALVSNCTNFYLQELLDLGEAVGTQNRGLSQERISSLPISKYKWNFFSRKKTRGER